MYVCMYTYTYTYVHTRTHLYIYIYRRIHIYKLDSHFFKVRHQVERGRLQVVDVKFTRLSHSYYFILSCYFNDSDRASTSNRYEDSHLFEFRHPFERRRLQVVDVDLTKRPYVLYLILSYYF